MSVQRPFAPALALSDDVAAAVAHLLFMPRSPGALERLRAELAAAGVLADDDRHGLRVDVGELDWRGLIQDIAAALTSVERNDTRVAILPRGGDERARRKALA